MPTNSIFGTTAKSGALMHAGNDRIIASNTMQVRNDIRDTFARRVLRVTAPDFDALSLDIFRYQFTHNPIYQKYAGLVGKDLHNVREVSDIPFLPVTLFKSHDISTNDWKPAVVFESSSTSGRVPARHAVRDPDLYKMISRQGFLHVFHQDISEFVWLALLPSYVERQASSLVQMASWFIDAGKNGSMFVNSRNASEMLHKADQGNHPVAFLSVTFALLDLAEKAQTHVQNTMIIETGGMKGRCAEPTRQQVHELIMSGFGVPTVCSEYGMTELLSQGWSPGMGIFYPAPGLRIYIRDLEDPMALLSHGARGGINCIDLANLDTCAFVATDDIGIRHEDGSFEVLGRFDASEIRGCNLMVENM